MRIVSLSALGFRNLSGFDWRPSPGLTVVVGDNGQGKTNLLEAIYYIATLKPLRAGKLEELIAWEKKVCRLKALVHEEIDRGLEVVISEGRRSATLDEKKPRSMEAYGDVLKVVAFTPDDLQLVKGSASNRRRWLDRATFTRRSAYLREHRDFERALKSRNRLLKRAKEEGSLPSELNVFDEAVARTGARVRIRRLETAVELAELAVDRFEKIASLGKALSVAYVANDDEYSVCEDKESISEQKIECSLLSALKNRRRVDQARGYSTAGPQSDDLVFSIGGRDARSYASQGQQRALVLSLKISEIENLREKLGKTPILLLDDVSSELDSSRNSLLIDYLSGFPGQAFVTTTDRGLFPSGEEREDAKMIVTAGSLTGEGCEIREIPG